MEGPEIVGLAWHIAVSDPIPNTAYGSLNSARKVPELKASNKPWAPPGVAQENKQKEFEQFSKFILFLDYFSIYHVSYKGCYKTHLYDPCDNSPLF